MGALMTRKSWEIGLLNAILPNELMSFKNLLLFAEINAEKSLVKALSTTLS